MNYFIKNGLYIPIFHGLLYYLNVNCNIINIIVNELYRLNHYIWFSHCYDYGIPKRYNFLRNYAYFSYNSNLSMILYYFYGSSILPIAYNINSFILFTFLAGRLALNERSTFEIENIEFNNSIDICFTYYTHIQPYVFFINEMESYIHFNNDTLLLSYLWVYTWIFLIYFPWVYITKDYLYTILNNLTLKRFIKFSILLNMIIYLINCSGSYFFV